jgi:hypothetical protein
VIAALSEPIGRVIKGSMKEAQEKRAELLDVEKKVLLELCEFTYMGECKMPLSDDCEGLRARSAR